MSNKTQLLKDLLIKPKYYQHSNKLNRDIEISPLITSFEKWSGKKKQLNIEDIIRISNNNISNWGLQSNLFANILSSDVRSELGTKTRLPKELLIQLKVTSSKKEDTEHCLNKLTMEPKLIHSKVGKNSYVLNSRHILDDLSTTYKKYIPRSLLQSAKDSNNVPNIHYTHHDIIKNTEDNINDMLRHKILDQNIEINKDVVFDKNNIYIQFQTQGSVLKMVKYRYPDGQVKMVAMFYMDNNKFSKNSVKNAEIVLNYSSDKLLINLLYKYITLINN